MTTNNSETLQFYRDSRRPQAWGGFFLALWMAIYIGGVVPIWVIAVGALLTMALMAAIVIKFRPKQLAASWNGKQLEERRLILPPRTHILSKPPKLLRYEEDIAALQFRDESNQLHEIYVVFDNDLETTLKDTDVETVDKR
ncbi:hypothetical protein [Idiomarina piscisalsi]|uniref:hypothetical protein n=1 Tax=Idiomarina piscisalsi TaxID=1096243 RepID=UPI0013836D7C|nr:hypothetical protein [Idiomarina piscisalsi]MTJ02518.1 hypothetical protein [Idiomarina piscisalsi]